MSALELKVYDIFKSRFSEQEASVVIEYVEEKINKALEGRVLLTQKIQTKDIEILKTEVREENAKIKGETNDGFAKVEGIIVKLEGKMNEGFVKLKGEMNEGFAKTRADSLDVKVEILRWMFGIFMAMMLAILGLYLKK